MIMRKQLLAFGVGLLSAATLSVSAQDLSAIRLNSPSADRGKTIMATLHERHSDRVFDTKELSLQDLSDLLWAANGVNRPGEKKRTAPSAMNRQEIDLYVFNKDGVYKYDAFSNTLQPVASGDHRQLIAGAQDFVLSAPVSLLMVADLSKLGGDDERSKLMGAADAGIETLATGAIRTNEFMQTNFADIYACGDNIAVKDFVDGTETTIALAGPANRQGRLIADHICGNPYPYTGSQGSGVVKVFNLTAAFTGNNERQLKKKNIAYKKMLIWGKSHAGYYPNSTPLALKVLYNAEGKILGAQAIGTEGVDKRIDIIATIMRLNGTYKDLRDAELCYAPPYSSAKDPINLIGMAIQNVEENRLKPYFGTDFQDMFVIDVRSPAMHKAGHLPNAINMPIPQLRQHLNEIPHNRPILLHCMIGYNSYLASCILRQNGFDNVFSYAGGFSQYKTQKD